MIFPTSCCTALSHLCTPKEKFTPVLRDEPLERRPGVRGKAKKNMQWKKEKNVGAANQKTKILLGLQGKYEYI